jgi:hypothetical protein
MDFNKVIEEGGDRSLDFGFKRLIAGKLEMARKDFAAYEDEIEKMALEVKDAVIGGDADAAYLTSVLGSAQKLVSALEAERKRITGDAYDFYKAVMSFEKNYSNRIKSRIISAGKLKLGEYSRKVEIERRAAESRAQEAARKKQEELDKMADEANVARVKIDEPVVPQETQPIRAETGTASTKMVWVVKVVNENKVPRKYCSPDLKKLKEAVNRAGVRKIAGTEITEEARVMLRAR